MKNFILYTLLLFSAAGNAIEFESPRLGHVQPLMITSAEPGVYMMAQTLAGYEARNAKADGTGRPSIYIYEEFNIIPESWGSTNFTACQVTLRPKGFPEQHLYYHHAWYSAGQSDYLDSDRMNSNICPELKSYLRRASPTCPVRIELSEFDFSIKRVSQQCKTKNPNKDNL